MFVRICLVLLFVLINSVISNSEDNNYIFPYKSLSNCKRSEIYDLDYFSCVNCDTNLNLIPGRDRTSCICNPKTSTTQIYYAANTQQPICSQKCKNCTDSSKGGQKCTLKWLAWNSTASKDIQIMERSKSETCSCDSKSSTQYSDYCIPNVLLKDFLSYSAFSQRAIYKDLPFVAFQCKGLRNRTACNFLANLCVASFYSLDKNSPCSHFFISQASDVGSLGVNLGVEDMNDVRPFLFFSRGKTVIQELEKTIDHSYSLERDSRQTNFLNFVVTSYSIDGRLVRMNRLVPQHFNLCNKVALSSYENFIFGQNYEMSCKITLEAIIDMASWHENQLFHNIFLNYSIDNVRYLRIVPILIRNAFRDNEENNREDWQLVKRFTPLFADTRPPADDTLSTLSGEDLTKVRKYKSIKYVNNFRIYCTIKDNNRISTPIIVLQYNQLELQPNMSLMEGYAFEFGIVFTRKHKMDFWFEILLPLFMAIAFAFALLRTFNFKTRQNKEYYDFSALLQFTLYLFSNCATAFFGIGIAVCFYVFVVYTSQSTVHILTPIEEQNLVEILIILACILKGTYLAFYFWKIAHIDIFFIDWERPKGVDAHLTARSHSDTPSVCSSARTMVGDSVSAWRNYFVANEWIKVSTNRRTSIFLQCLLVLIVMKGLETEFPALYRDKTLFLALSAVTFISVYILQVTIVFIVCDRIVGNPLQQFVDICSTANISVFILLQESYGFYIHGRSPHGFSDTDMSSMIIQLQRESQNMCGRRGLLTGSDQQTYIILAPTNLKSYYKKLLIPFQRAANTRLQIHIEDDYLNHKSYESSLEKTALAYSTVNRFFCAFIDHAIKDLDYIVKERTFMEVLLNCEFENYLSESKGTFYIDNGHAFDRVLLYGNDFQHFIFDMMLFSAILIGTDSLIISTFVITICYKVFQIVFRGVVKNNLSAKTLIDKRFLI